jgi:hypothetical protein
MLVTARTKEFGPEIRAKIEGLRILATPTVAQGRRRS